MYTYVVMAEHHSLGISSGPRLFECVRKGGREGRREGGREGGRMGGEGARV